jgi:hypothetical protein
MFSTLIFPNRANEVLRQEVASPLHFQYVLGPGPWLPFFGKGLLTLKSLPNGQNRGLLQQRLKKGFAALNRCY